MAEPKKMSDLKKKRMRYELLEDMEDWLNNRIAYMESDIALNSSDDCLDEDGKLPEWRLDAIDELQMTIDECREIQKYLLKL